MSPCVSPGYLPVAYRTAAVALLVVAVLFTARLGAQTLTGPTRVTVTNVNTRVVGSTTVSSSSRLTVSWAAPTGYTIDHYEIRAVEAGFTTQLNAAAAQTSATLTDLKSSTAYSVTVRACQDAGCVAYGESAAVSGTTSAEYWQVQGTGNAASTATVVVSQSSSMGSVMAWPVLYGAEAGSSLQGKVRLYFKGGTGFFNTSTALSGIATAAPASVSFFTHDTNYGLRDPRSTDYPTGATAAFIKSDVSAPQAIPRSVGGTPHIRLFFKAVGDNSAAGNDPESPYDDFANRLFHFDSQDQLTGQDFHPGAPTIVSSGADWTATAPTIAMGVTGDATAGDTGLLQVRQTKVGLPLLTNWLWNDAPGTFAVITGQDGCGQTGDGLFLAQFDGTRWNVSKDASQCARLLVKYAHGPILLHRGGTRFKLYYEDRVVSGSEALKPLRMLYGDGSISGPSSLEFDDWEAEALARDVHFLWPDGSAVAAPDESGFGDHVVYYPTTDTDVQFMYMNLTGLDGTPPLASIGIGMAVLINDMCPDYMTANRATNVCVPGVTTQPANATTVSGTAATFSVAATGSPTPSYLWQVSTNGGTTWSSLTNTASYSGAMTATLTVTAPTVAMSTYQYRALATNTGGAVTSTVAALTVNGSMTALPSGLRFGATVTGSTLQVVTSAQTVTVTFDGAGSAWSAASNQSWLQLTGGAGNASGTFTAQVVPGAVPAGSTSLTATITVASTGAITSSRTLAVTLTVTPAAAATVPFGSFDTPAAAASVAGSIPVTGWALDDIEVSRVEIWRDKVTGETTPGYAGGGLGNGKIFIANAFFIGGARPDVEAAYATMPFASRGGWGYLLLTQGLWNQGNGAYTLHAFAYDREGRSVTLGSKAITVNNATATKPFGGIDVPAYGQTVSGSFFNFGWALTPNATPTCTIGTAGVQVAIDSGPLQPVSYGDLRPDIAAAFPGLSNGAGAGGAYYLNSSALSNGTHQIGWYVVDNCSRAEGIGSRFFTVLNAGSTVPLEARPTTTAADAVRQVIDQPVMVRRGFEVVPIEATGNGDHLITLRQEERIEIELPATGGAPYVGYQVVNGARRALPAGSSLDGASGVFYWQPATGFLGTFALEFIPATGGVVLVQVTVR